MAEPEREPQQVIITSGAAGLVTSTLKILSGLTTDKMLTLFVVAGFGWMLFVTFQAANQDKQNSQRHYDDARERDRQHCDSREEKLARDRDAENEKMRAWYAGQAESQRRFEAEQRDRDRMQYAEVARVIAARLQARPPAPPGPDE